LVNTLNVLAAVPEIEHTLVVSRDPQALAIAREHGARTVQEQGAPQLNLALARATMLAISHAVLGVLVLPADLPLITVEDIRQVVSRATRPPVVVISPDRHRRGTNALLVSPAGMIVYTFGIGSFERHCNLTRKHGARLEICELPNLALDIDLPQDLEMVRDELNNLKAFDRTQLERVIY
jgi:2-phospho-L-lactate guanylyltransferase